AFRLKCTRAPSASAGRLRWLFVMFVICLLTVFARLVALELHDGPEYRAQAAEPIVRERSIPTIRGRILARDGTVLARDQSLASIAIAYRWPAHPSQPRWLRQMAGPPLTIADRPNPSRLAAVQQIVLGQRKQLITRLAALCQLTD